ncbi:MAG: 30S ribosomal protein S16 [Patescibacteria group bacterium]
MLRIKLSPIGKKKQIHYRISVVESKSKLTGRPVEVLGHFHPVENKLTLDQEKLKYWVGQGAQISEKVKSLCKTL